MDRLQKKMKKICEMRGRLGSSQIWKLVYHCIEEYERDGEKGLWKRNEEYGSIEEFMDAIVSGDVMNKRVCEKEEKVIIDEEKEYYKRMTMDMMRFEKEVGDSYEVFMDRMKMVEGKEDNDYLKMSEVIEMFLSRKGIKQDMCIKGVYEFLKGWDHDIMTWDRYIEGRWFEGIIGVLSREDGKGEYSIMEELKERYPCLIRYGKIMREMTRNDRYETFKKIQKEGNMEDILWGLTRCKYRIRETNREDANNNKMSDDWSFCLVHDRELYPEECLYLIQSDRVINEKEPVDHGRLSTREVFQDVYHRKSYMTRDGILCIRGLQKKNRSYHLFHVYKDRIEMMTREEYMKYKESEIDVDRVLREMEMEDLPLWVYERLRDVYNSFMESCDIEEEMVEDRKGTVKERIQRCFEIVCRLHKESPYYKYHYCLRERYREIVWNGDGKIPEEMVFPEYYLWEKDERDRYREHKEKMEDIFCWMFIKRMKRENIGCLSRHWKEFHASSYSIPDLYIDPKEPNKMRHWRKQCLDKRYSKYIKQKSVHNKNDNLQSYLTNPSLSLSLFLN